MIKTIVWLTLVFSFVGACALLQGCRSVTPEERCVLAGVQVTKIVIETAGGIVRDRIECNLPESIK